MGQLLSQESKRMKRILGILMVVILPVSLSHSVVLETIDAIVNDELILSGEVNARILLKAQQLNLFLVENNVRSLPKETYETLRPQVLAQMIDELLLLQAVRSRLKTENFTFLREDTQRKTDYAMEQFRTKLKTAEDLAQEENRRNMTWEEIRQATYQEIYNDNIRKIILNQIINRQVEAPTVEEIETYRQQTADNPPTGNVNIQQIQFNIPPNATPEEEKSILQNAQEVALRARGGDPFDFLVYLFSQNEDTKKNNGLITIERGQILPEFNPVFELNVGDITDPIRTATGYHVLRVVYKDTLEARILEDKKKIQFNKWLTDLRKTATILEHDSKNLTPIVPKQLTN